MKKLFLTLTFIFVSSLSLTAQSISDNAIGIRFGGGNGIGGEISYQKGLSENNRLEIDLGLANDFSDFKAIGLYQWVWNLENKFNWYAGAGGGLVSAGDLGIFASGVVGIEYNFDAPVLISLDYRPEIGIAGGLSGLTSDVALAVKYQF